MLFIYKAYIRQLPAEGPEELVSFTGRDTELQGSSVVLWVREDSRYQFSQCTGWLDKHLLHVRARNAKTKRNGSVEFLKDIFLQ
jgi:hypothetical protein